MDLGTEYTGLEEGLTLRNKMNVRHEGGSLSTQQTVPKERRPSSITTSLITTYQYYDKVPFPLTALCRRGNLTHSRTISC